MPPPLPLPPIPDLPPARPAPRRWPGYVMLAAVTLLLALVLAYGLQVVGQARASGDRSKTSDGVKAVLADQEAAWNRGELDGFMAGYWNDERLRFYSGGDVTAGWQPTRDRFHKKYKADGKEMGTLTFRELEVEPLGPDVAFAHGRWGLVYAKSDDRPGGLFTVILRRTPDGWKIVHDHTSVPEPKKN